MDPHLTSVLGFSTAITAASKESNEPPPRRNPNDYQWLQQALEANRPKDEPTQMKVIACSSFRDPCTYTSLLGTACCCSGSEARRGAPPNSTRGLSNGTDAALTTPSLSLTTISQLIEHPYNAGSMSIRLVRATGTNHTICIDIKKMNMWEPLINLLQDSSPSIQRATLAILSSAIQNDEGTRRDVRKLHLSPIHVLITSSSSINTTSCPRFWTI